MSELKKKCTVVMLPTGKAQEKKGIGYSKTTGKLYPYEHNDHWGMDQQHLYICSEDEIKEGDYVLPTQTKTGEMFFWRKWFVTPLIVQKLELNEVSLNSDLITINHNNDTKISGRVFHKFDFFKVIASTDSSLNLPTVSDAFIQKYITAFNADTPITDVMVEYESVWDHTKPLLYSDDYESKEQPKLRNNEIIITRCKDSWSRDEMCTNMQYYMEYCQSNEYVTPHVWLDTLKHF